MLIAEIRRKLLALDDIEPTDADAIDRVKTLLSSCKEDLLTADVFGAIKYLPRVPYLTAVLQAIAERNRSAARFQAHLGRLAACAEQFVLDFWPSYKHVDDMPGDVTEPDVELAAPGALIFFEAKLFSGFGSSQVERQLLIGLECAPDCEFFLVLVTAGTRPPRLKVKTTGERLTVPTYLQDQAVLSDIPPRYRDSLGQNADRVLWISWQAIMLALARAHAQHCIAPRSPKGTCCREGDLLTDLRTLLEMRRLQPFTGIGRSTDCSNYSRPVFFAAALVSGRPFHGVSTNAIAGLLTIHALPDPVFFCSSAWRRRRFMRSTIADYDPHALPPQWLVACRSRNSGQFIERIVSKCQPESLPACWSASQAITDTQIGRSRANSSRLIGSVVENYDPQGVLHVAIGPSRTAVHRKRSRKSCFSAIVAKVNLPNTPLRLFKEEKHS